MLSKLNLDKTSSIPLHQQLYRFIKEAILSGKLKNGEKLPTEEEYRVAFGLSRPVIRQAYKQLLDEHLIYRQKGKGSFVKHKDVHYGLLASTKPLSEKIRMSGLEPSSIELEHTIIGCEEMRDSTIQFEKDTRYMKIKRLYKGDDQVLFYFEFYRPLSLFPELETLDKSKTSISQYLVSHPLNIVDYAKRTIHAVVLSDELCDHFNIDSGSPGFKLDTIAYGLDGKVIEYSIAYIQGQNVSVSFDF
jgi:GntR family transcriptional regulator